MYGGLEGVEFASRCPPDVQKGTRIIAVCGITESTAAPQDDGWFFSDFFLFYQMLNSRRTYKFKPFALLFTFLPIDTNTSLAELPNQLWLSSCSPSDLIRKHTRYLHGPATGIAGDRRVVMNETMLPKDEMQAGFRVFEPKDLLERFLATLRSEIIEAARTKQPVLVFIFGHGEKKSSGIFIGCDEDGCLQLNEARLASVLKKGVQTTLVLTSCYSGGWLMKPNYNSNFDVKPTFNHSFLTAAGAKNKSLSWALSQSVGRQAGGSVFATCLLNSIITASDRAEGFYNGERKDSDESKDEGQSSGDFKGNLIKVHEDDEGEEMSLSMAALTRQVRYECEARYGTLWEKHNFSFAAQDDMWAKAWGNRTGLPLLDYKATWEKLPEAPVEKIVYPPAGSLTGSIMSRSPKALYNIVRVKAIRYMESKPGPDNGGCNTNCHPGFHKLVEGAPLEFEKLYYLDGILDYREAQMVFAELYCEFLEIGVPEGQKANQFDEDEWEDTQLRLKNGRSPKDSMVATDLLKRFYTIRGWVNRLGIFDSPGPGQGFDYSKCTEYLAARLAESRIPTQQIHGKLEILLQSKCCLPNTYSHIF